MLPNGITIKVCWMEIDGETPLVDYIASLIAKPEDFGSLVDAMRRLSDQRWWGKPNTLKLQGKPYKGIFELRVKSGNKYMRAPFILTSDAEVVLMFGETKKRASPTQSFMDKARKYRDMINNKEANYEQIDFDQFEE